MIKGFTLIEALVTILIFSFAILGIYGFLNYARINYDTNLVWLNLQQQARQGMSWLSREVRQAYWPPEISGPDAYGNQAITFRMTPDANYVCYSVVKEGSEPWQLKRTDTTGTKKRANDITNLTFSSPGGRILTITVTARKTFSSFGKVRTLTFPLTQQVKVRN